MPSSYILRDEFPQFSVVCVHVTHLWRESHFPAWDSTGFPQMGGISTGGWLVRGSRAETRIQVIYG